MQTRSEREKQLRAMMQTKAGMQAIGDLYMREVVPPGQPAKSGILTVQMIPLILDAEFPPTQKVE
jgi:hypothetical protein